LLADSGPATPSIAPWPKDFGFFETFFSIAYEANEARTCPAPGRMPSADPMPVPRSTGPAIRRRSARDGITFRTFSTMTVRPRSSSRLRRISATPNMPTATDTKLIPE
jgi:hypothetical protein